MTKLQKCTVLVIIGNVLALAAYDIWVASQGGAPATLSWVISWSSQQWWSATLVLAVGYLLGHLFAQDGKVNLDGTITSQTDYKVSPLTKD